MAHTTLRRLASTVVIAFAAIAAQASAHGSATASQATTLYASPNGSGSACTRQHPCSLSGAQRKVRSLHPSSGHTAVTVLLKGGTYNLSKTWQFTAADSGSSAHPVVWKAASGGLPVISGGARVTGWSPVTGTTNLWQANVLPGSNSRNLYVNGQDVPVAQQTPTQLGFAGGWTGSSSGYDISNDPTAEQFFASLTPAQLKRVEFTYTGGNGAWTQSECRVASYSDGTLTMDEPCWQNVTDRLSYSDASGGLPSMSTSRLPTEIGDAYALLTPGHWFLDTAANKLYFDGPSSMTGMRVELPRLQALVRGVGSLSRPLHNVTLSGLQFSYATWNTPSDPAGFADVQSNLRMTLPGGNQGMCTFSSPAGTCPWGALTGPLANVGFSGADHITLTGDRFEHLGGAAVGLEYGDSEVTVSDSFFDGIGSTSLLLGCTYDPNPTIASDAAGIRRHCSLDPALTAHDKVGNNEILNHTLVADNVIEHIGADYPSASGITLLFSRHTTITHNEIFDTPYTGITAGVIQGHVDSQLNPENTTNIDAFNTLSYNDIHDYIETLDDGGAMYIEGHQSSYVYNRNGTLNVQKTLADGMHAIGNVTYNKVGYSPAFYDDAGSEYINWENNVAFRLNGNSAQGGCDPSGPFRVTGNWASGGFEGYGCLPSGVTIPTQFYDNTRIPDSPGPNDLPAAKFDSAGVSAAVAKQYLSAPHAFYVSPESGSTTAIPNAVLIAGEGFTSGVPVYFGTKKATKVQALSPDFLIATVPAGADPASAVVGPPLTPQPTITTPAAGAVNVNGSSVTVSGAGPNGATIAVEVNSIVDSGCTATVTDEKWSCTIASIPSGQQSLTATATHGYESISSSPTDIYVGGTPPASDRVNDTDPSIVYSSGWSYSSDRSAQGIDGDYDNDIHYATNNGATCTWTFIGTGIQVYGELSDDQGNVGISIDGGPAQTVSTLPPTSARVTDDDIFQDDDLTPGQHTITVTKLSGTYSTLDGFAALYAQPAAPAQSKKGAQRR